MTINLIDRTSVYNQAYIDLSVQCCDDATTWPENKCFSVPKCSLTLYRIRVTDIPSPVYCSNNEKSLVISDNLPPSADIFQFQCLSNNTQQTITYKLLQPSNYLTVNSSTGVLSLIRSVKYEKLGFQSLTVECSNELMSSQCRLDLTIVADRDVKPIWIYPNIVYFQDCVVLGQYVNAIPGSLITEIQAYSPDLSRVEYFFVNQNRLNKNLFEFKVETLESHGRIVLNSNIDRNFNLFREVGLFFWL